MPISSMLSTNKKDTTLAQQGFTLIELMVVIGIIVLLTGMLMPILGIAQRQARIANTKAILMKVDQAIRLFRTDMRIYPWQFDLGAPPAEPTAWSNNLAYRLAWNPPTAGSGTVADPDRMTYLSGFRDDVSSILARFTFVNGTNVPPRGSQTEGTHAFRNEIPAAGYRTNLLLTAGSLKDTVNNLGGWTPNTYDSSLNAQVLTSMAREISVLKYTAGQLPTQAPMGIDPADPIDKADHPAEDERYVSARIGAIPFGYVPYNRAGDSRGPVLTTAAAKARGWRADYLSNELRTVVEAENGGSGRLGDAILDAWGRPLVYVCTVVPGCRGSWHGCAVKAIESDTQENRYNMDPQGRLATNALASDVRLTAAPPYAFEFELWSAGPDGAFKSIRQDPVNRDNVSVLPYLRGMQ